MQRTMGQLSLSDGLVETRPSFLAEVDALVDWAPIEQTLSGIYDSRTGRPSYPLLLLFKTLLLQQWYGLSDPAMEEALADRISFRRFTGLSLSDPVPDHTTIHRFRAQLSERLETLMQVLNAQFEAHGYIIKRGTLLDASFVKSSSGKRSVDPDAGRYGLNRSERVSGYKAHVSVDEGSGIVRRVRVSAANVNDTVIADELILGDEQAVYADKAYDTKARRKRLTDQGVFAGILHRPGPRRPLSQDQREFNKRMSKTRAPVERIFAVLKNHYGLRKTRYRGQHRTATQITLACIAMNLKRALVLANA